MTLTTFLEAQYAPLRMVREENRKQFAIQIRHFERHLGRASTLADLTDAAVSRFLVAFAKGRSIPTVNKARTHLLALWRFAARKRFVADFPDVMKLVEPRRIPQAWTLPQLQALFAATTQMIGQYGPVPAPQWWAAFLRVLFDTGERAGAALAIEWDWLDLQTGRLVIPAEYRKGRSKDAEHWLRPATLAMVKALPRKGRQVFPFPLERSSYFLHFAKLLKRAGLPFGRKHKSQKMRRCFASYLEAAGGNATEGLLHSDRGVTEKFYLDPQIVGKKPASRLLPDVG